MQSQTLDGLKITSRVTLLEPGMYIFRYASQPQGERSVLVALQQAPLGKGVIDFFPAEGVSKNMLTKLGDCVIGRVKGGVSTVLITEYYLADVEIDPIDLRIDRIDTSAAIMRNFMPATPPPEAVAFSQVAPTKAVLKLTGHLETGESLNVTDELLGDATGSARLEGFSVTWDNKPAGVDLAYTSTVAGAGPSQKVLSGSFTGARSKGAALVAVGFGLTGPDRAHYDLLGYVIFAGAAPQAIAPEQMLFGPSGVEPLVAIQLSITPKTEINALRHKSLREKPAFTQTDSNIGQLA